MLVVLGLDSLDAKRVRQFSMPALEQFPEQGRMAPPGNLDPDELFTGYLWPSMLAGRHPRELFPEHFGESAEDASLNEWSFPFLNTSLAQTIERLMVEHLSRETKDWIKARLGQAGIEQERRAPKVLEAAGSVLDTAAAPRLISVPGINGDPSNTELKKMVEGSSDDKRTSVEPEEFERAAARADIDRLIRMLSAVRSRRHDLLVTHFFSLDLIQHLWVESASKMRRWYLLYDNIVRQTMSEIDEEDTVVVVSDHGMQSSGLHSMRAYYAASKPLWGDGDYRATDLREVLERELQRGNHGHDSGSRQETFKLGDETREHLENLGYF